ncbi:hypothetical protein [Poseidonocella pacifica]|nr:hypothetical protein [Poseidonocella pacifica]
MLRRSDPISNPSLLRTLQRGIAAGPVAVLLMEDAIEATSTVAHHLNLGFGAVLVLSPPDLALDLPDDPRVHQVEFDTRATGALPDAVNLAANALPGRWIYYGYNAEYLFFPFSETRSIGELLTFHGEERREAMLAYVVDLYAPDLSDHPNAVDLPTAHLDTAGYYALARQDAVTGATLERQLDFYGGLRWRFEEHVPQERRRIDRISLFRARSGVRLRADHTHTDEEWNTYACPWHHNLTAVIASFRTAKALKRNPGSTFDIPSFMWRNSAPFEWHSQQLMDLGLMEPGQWF